jgi:aminomethyltransferase
MVTETVSLAQAYEAAHHGAIVVNRSDLGLLKFTGETRLDLLQRMSTGDVKDLRSGEGAATILTTDIGRMIDRLLLHVSSEAVYALTGEDNADNIARYLMRFVFFQDDFHIEDLSDDTAIFGVYGQEATGRLSSLWNGAFGDEDALPRHHWRQLALNGTAVYVHRTDAVAGDGYFVMCDMDVSATVWEQLLAADIVPASAEAFDYLRIESGLPRFGYEISEEYIPLEAGLWSDVSFRKGCYIGQEIIARMESRGRLAKQLVQLGAEAPVSPGAMVQADGRGVGTVTSVGEGPAGVLALAYVKTKALEEDAKVELRVGNAALAGIEPVRR